MKQQMIDRFFPQHCKNPTSKPTQSMKSDPKSTQLKRIKLKRKKKLVILLQSTIIMCLDLQYFPLNVLVFFIFLICMWRTAIINLMLLILEPYMLIGKLKWMRSKNCYKREAMIKNIGWERWTYIFCFIINKIHGKENISYYK
jgi:hypothetical protein